MHKVWGRMQRAHARVSLRFKSSCSLFCFLPGDLRRKGWGKRRCQMVWTVSYTCQTNCPRSEEAHRARKEGRTQNVQSLRRRWTKYIQIHGGCEDAASVLRRAWTRDGPNQSLCRHRWSFILNQTGVVYYQERFSRIQPFSLFKPISNVSHCLEQWTIWIGRWL